MNILLVTETYFPYITGVSVSTDNIARFMLRRGHNVTLVYPKPIVNKDFDLPKGLNIVYVPSLPFYLYNNNATGIFPLTICPIEKVVKNGHFDVMHIQEPGSVGLSALIVAKKYKIPTVGALHFIPEQIDRVLWGRLENVLTPFINFIIKPIYNNYDQIMTPSHFFAGYLRGIGVKTPVNVVSNGVDTNIYKPSTTDPKLRMKYGFTKSDVVFFFLGRLDKDKNPETLVKALPFTTKNVKLIIVGRGTETKYLHELAKTLKVDDKITWIDYVTNEEMINIYSSVDAFCIMSPYEGQSIVTLQAVSAGLAVIAARAGALPELVSDSKNGYLIDTYNFKELSEKMNLLAASPSQRRKFGHESRKISLEHDRNKALRSLEKIYIMLTDNAQR